ncbi:hypothetical protein HYV43_03670 [Candidatus Micrarchaeota archaeon]|nr:hypothetical protein [Candidatus Micrarchaeota archaeon]
MADNPSSQKTLSKSKARKPAAKKIKVTKFDKDLVKLIQSGVTRFSDWCQLLGVDETQARARVDELVQRGYLAPDAQWVGVYRLGIEGYNKYGSLKIKAAAKEASKPSVEEKPSLSLPSPALPRPSPSFVPAASGSAALPLLAVPIAPPIPAARSSMDLAEMLAKGAPGGRVLKKDGSMCELCRGEFKVSLKEPKLAKFAHCVCGAAYHEDCYHSLMEGGAGCARCGRKLSAVLDRGSQEALKFVKDAFE